MMWCRIHRRIPMCRSLRWVRDGIIGTTSILLIMVRGNCQHAIIVFVVCLTPLIVYYTLSDYLIHFFILLPLVAQPNNTTNQYNNNIRSQLHRNSASPLNSILANCSSTCWQRSDWSGGGSVARQRGIWAEYGETEIGRRVCHYPSLPRGHGRIRRMLW